MLNVISRVPFHFLYRYSGWPEMLPMNLTFSVSYRCNSRCKTCNIHKKKAEELTLGEWEKIFSKIGKSLFWATISGGEPFLRDDLPDLVCMLYDKCRPSIINIPTNGLLVERVPVYVKRIAEHCRQSQLVINVSIDGIEEEHDNIRGVPGSYKRAVETFHRLKGLKEKNLSVGIHTVISRFNVSRIPAIYEHLRALRPDSYITEIAEEREELETVGTDITPSIEEYGTAVDFLTRHLQDGSFNKVGKLTRAFRLEYYQMVKKVLRHKRQIIPCYAGIASGQIAPDGDVWMCCVKAESAGNLRDFGYDIQKIWFSENTRELRARIKNGECYCPLANASYTNMLHHVETLCRVSWHLVRTNG
jgi:MoaA/NifB/PqqE/SkfB family radical SAM enzyme